MGLFNGYIAALENVLSKIDDNTKIIPGHGPMAVKADLVSTVMLKEVRSRVAAQIEQGLDEEAAVAADPLDLNPNGASGSSMESAWYAPPIDHCSQQNKKTPAFRGRSEKGPVGVLGLFQALGSRLGR